MRSLNASQLPCGSAYRRSLECSLPGSLDSVLQGGRRVSCEFLVPLILAGRAWSCASKSPEGPENMDIHRGARYLETDADQHSISWPSVQRLSTHTISLITDNPEPAHCAILSEGRNAAFPFLSPVVLCFFILFFSGYTPPPRIFP